MIQRPPTADVRHHRGDMRAEFYQEGGTFRGIHAATLKRGPFGGECLGRLAQRRVFGEQIIPAAHDAHW